LKELYKIKGKKEKEKKEKDFERKFRAKIFIGSVK
jgi:hypothetical protein